MTFYSKLAATSLKLLTKYGRPVTLRQYSASGGDYDPNTGKATLATFIDSIRNCVVADQPGNQIAVRFGLTMEASTLMQNKNKWIYMDAKGAQPQLQDHIIFDGVDYTIVSSQATSPGGTPLLYLIVLES
jgi:hypothetical protein